MARSITDSREEAIQPATVADLLVWESLPAETRRAVKSALFDEIEEEVGNQSCEYHDSEIQNLEGAKEKLTKALTECRDLVEDFQERFKREMQNLVDAINEKVKGAVDD
jgi:TRAP-type C4-dicarboxylate transport system substrate-binding protein